MEQKKCLFSCMAEDAAGLAELKLFVESLRRYGGQYADCPVEIYVAACLEDAIQSGFPEDCLIYPVPDIDPEGRPFFFANKVFCAAVAEGHSAEEGRYLVWVDNDTLVLNEPTEMLPGKGKAASLCPVMHNRTGVAWGESPGKLWDFLDTLFGIDPDSLSPLTAPADGLAIRPYFNAGFMVVDPDFRLMRRWKERFLEVCRNQTVLNRVAGHPDERIFLHQIVLTEVILAEAGLDLLSVLPDSYNYPLFFGELFPAIQPFDDISNARTVRYDTYFRNPRPGWQNRLKGPPEKILWLVRRLEQLGQRESADS